MRDLFDQDRPAEEGKMLAELRSLVTSGMFSSKFAEDLTLMFITLDEARALRDEPVHMYFLSMPASVVSRRLLSGAVDNANKGHFSTESTTTERYTVDTIPEDIMGKLSVLAMMVDAETYVDDVGYRADEGLFYVVRS